MNHYAIILVGFFILHLQHKKSLASVLSARCRSRCLAKVCTQRSANFPKCVMNLSVKSLTGCDLVTRVLRSLMLQVTKFCFELPIISGSAWFLILILFFFFRGLSRVTVTAWKCIPAGDRNTSQCKYTCFTCSLWLSSCTNLRDCFSKCSNMQLRKNMSYQKNRVLKWKVANFYRRIVDMFRNVCRCKQICLKINTNP